MQNVSFPHMEWAKAHARHPLPVELGFSGAPRPPGADFREHGPAEARLEARIARRYGVPKDHVYLIGGTSLANFVAIAAFCEPGRAVAVETPRYAPLAEIPRGLGGRVVDVPRGPSGRLGPLPRGALLAVVSTLASVRVDRDVSPWPEFSIWNWSWLVSPPASGDGSACPLRRRFPICITSFKP